MVDVNCSVNKETDILENPPASHFPELLDDIR